MAAVFEEKVVWITGGGSGIGQAMAVEFGRQRAKVVVSGRRIETLEATVALVEAQGGQCRARSCDVTKVSEIESTVEAIIEEFGRLDVVVANAGFSVTGRFEELSASDWRRQFETNVVGLAMTVKYAIPYLRQTKGRIALLGSVAGMLGLPKNGPYSASKFAVRGVGQTLTAELAADGISCTTLIPGFVESEIARVDNQGRFRKEWKDQRPQKLMWSAERAARVMVKAIARRRSEAVITGHGKVASFFAMHAPRLTQTIVARAGQNARRRMSDE